MKTLLLTPWMTPHKVIGWQNAITLIFLKKIEVLEEYEEEISSPSFGSSYDATGGTASLGVYVVGMGVPLSNGT